MLGIQRISPRFFARLTCGLLSFALFAILGCADDGLGKRYPVSGTVTYKGEPLAKGTISFYSTSGAGAEARGAFGTITNGKYTLSTQGESDGAFPGDYVVGVSSKEVDLSQAEKNVVKGGSFRQDDVMKANKSAKSLIPKKYEVPETGGLKAKVEAKSNRFDFDLTD